MDLVATEEQRLLRDAALLYASERMGHERARALEERAGSMDVSDGERLTRWREGLRRNRAALARHRGEGLERFNTALAVVEKLRLIETELSGALSADLRAALAFSRGAAGSR